VTVSINYGLKGGTLDATRHVQAALPRLLTQVEQDAFHLRTLHGEPLRGPDVIAVCTQPGRLDAESN
jgi:hypothetical protein